MTSLILESGLLVLARVANPDAPVGTDVPNGTMVATGPREI
jgi:hypothetical protein